MLEGRIQRTRAAGSDVRGRASETKTSPRSARRGPAPLTARRSCEHCRSAGQVRAQGARAHPSAVSLPIWEPRAWGQSRRGASGEAAGREWRRPSGLGGNPSAAPRPSLRPWSSPGRCPPRPLSRLPTSSPVPPGARPLPASLHPALRLPLTGRQGSPEPPPPPGLGPSRRPPPHVPRVAIASTLASSPPPLSPPPPPPSPQSPAEAEAAPAAARTRGEAPAHYVPRWGRGRPAAAWELGARGKRCRGGRGRPGTHGRRREPPTFLGRGCARSRAVPDAAEVRHV